MLIILLVCMEAAQAQRMSSKNTGKKANAQQLKKELNSLESQMKYLREKINKKHSEARAVRHDIAEIDRNLETTQQNLQSTERRLRNARMEQQGLAKRLSLLAERLKRREVLLKDRLKAAYKHRSVSYISVLAGARSMDDLLSRGYVLGRIVRTDRALMLAVRQDRDEVAAAKKRQDALVTQIAMLERRLNRQAVEYEYTQGEKKQVLGQINQERAAYEQQLAELEAESRSIAARIRAMQQTPAGRARAQKPYSGQFGRPVAGSVTSRFGMRFHPIFKVNKMHTGVDYGAQHGASISAAGDGVVIEAGYRRGYGNTVIIDHGGGLATLYAHCSAVLVSEGKEIKRGQTIARVGSTGYATGPHLHFEVRVNGEPVNPAAYGF
jgi:murein DD-endopeptidase MepM/ murein hydrolase activator NlpD